MSPFPEPGQMRRREDDEWGYRKTSASERPNNQTIKTTNSEERVGFMVCYLGMI